MPDYQKGKIYKIWSPSKNLVYYGSTIETISARLAKHKSQYKAYTNDNAKLYVSSYLVLECEDYKIELIEDYPCNNKEQLHKREGDYIKNNECVNMQIAGRTKQEWEKENIDKVNEAKQKYCEANYDKVKEAKQKYCETNPDKVKETKQKYCEKNVEKIRESQKKLYQVNIEKHKEYRKKNADKTAEYDKIYRDANADKIKEYKRLWYLKKKELKDKLKDKL
jgi:hypothetical protein